jgi:hypothetical protein
MDKRIELIDNVSRRCLLLDPLVPRICVSIVAKDGRVLWPALLPKCYCVRSIG